MSALTFAKNALGFEKPHSSITDWVEILTSNKIEEEAYEGVPELADSITLQASGPAEAARALRKKLKHGQPHQQYRALVLIKALVENAGPKFHAAFSDGQLVEAFKQVNSDSLTDKRVKKKLVSVLASWRDQYQSEPSMALFANLHRQCKGEFRPRNGPLEPAHLVSQDNTKEEKRKAKEEAKRREKLEREERRRKEEEERRNKVGATRRVLFNLEKERPKVLSTIAEASQASSNLSNALMLINAEADHVQSNERVQECLAKAKQAKKVIVRYIQLVEDEDLIGALIETNDRIDAALETYEALSNAKPQEVRNGEREITSKLLVTKISESGEMREGKNGQPLPSQGREIFYPELQDLNFGALDASSSKLPAPIKPSQLSDNYQSPGRGSLSDFSDYVSSDEEAHKARKDSLHRTYIDASDDSEGDTRDTRVARAPLVSASDDDPFADPFADEAGIWSR